MAKVSGYFDHGMVKRDGSFNHAMVERDGNYLKRAQGTALGTLHFSQTTTILSSCVRKELFPNFLNSSQKNRYSTTLNFRLL